MWYGSGCATAIICDAMRYKPISTKSFDKTAVVLQNRKDLYVNYGGLAKCILPKLAHDICTNWHYINDATYLYIYIYVWMLRFVQL